ncbi:MAG TPA: hypothetical protein VMU47_01580 [Caldimonas sp.]|nr:hypothetical protein [Caldimonas sp.]
MATTSVLRTFGPDCAVATATRWKWALLALVALVGCIDVWALSNWRASIDPDVHGTLGLELALPVQGWQKLRRVDPQSPLRAAGATVGDEVRIRPGDAFLRDLRTDETIRVELRSSTGVRALDVQPVSDPAFAVARAVVGFVAGWLAHLIALLIGTLLILRRSESIALRGLAVYLVLQTVGGWYLSLPGGTFHDQGVTWLFLTLDVAGGLAALWFAIQASRDRALWRRAWARDTFAGFPLLFALPIARWYLQWHGDVDTSSWDRVPVIDWLSRESGYWAAWFVLDTAMLLFLWSAWRHAKGPMRPRLAWIGIALGVPKLWLAVQAVIFEFQPLVESPQGRWPFLVEDLAFLLGTLVLGWAVLRHRVFNLGLVVQRALVLSVVSTPLIMLLGLGKWLTETWLHASGGKRHFVYDAVVAMVVVGVFALLQSRTTALASRVFFRRWQEKARAFRDFVDRAALIDDAGELKRRFVEAVDRFSDAPGSALYTLCADGALECTQHTLAGAPARIEPDSDLARQLAQGMVDVTRLDEGLPADWAFPMTARGALSGALLVAPRDDGIAYRREELEQLADSARHIGVCLEALRVVDLERAHRDLERRYQDLVRSAAVAPAR